MVTWLTTRPDAPTISSDLSMVELLSACRRIDDTSLDDWVRRSHHQAFDLVGLDVGTPVIGIGGRAFFGPVMTPAPTGEAAGRLFDGFSLVTEADGFFELKRSRDRQPSFE